MGETHPKQSYNGITSAMKYLIVGAGPTGLTAGIELIRHGIIPRVY